MLKKEYIKTVDELLDRMACTDDVGSLIGNEKWVLLSWLIDEITKMENDVVKHNNYSLGYLRACKIIKDLITSRGD
jgi:hypothetical protein